MTRFLIIAIVSGLTLTSLHAENFPVLPFDGIPWSFEQPSRIVAIGDIHADPDALLQILDSQGLIDGAGHWKGADAHLVLMGDLIDRGPHSRAAIDLVMRIEKEAEATHGKVHTLIGNHDTMVLDHDIGYATISEMEDYKDFQNTQEGKRLQTLGYRKEQAGFIAAFSGDTTYARWLRSRNSIIKIGSTVFAHAGIGTWPASTDVGQINATARACIHGLQSGGPIVSDKYHWTIVGIPGKKSAPNPSWMRDLADGTLPESTLNAHLKASDAERVVIAHTPTRSGEIETAYHGKVIRVDTNNSVGYASRPHGLSALEIRGNPVGGSFQTGAIVFHSQIPRNPLPHPLSNGLGCGPATAAIGTAGAI
jgi:hypothetical protein